MNSPVLLLQEMLVNLRIFLCKVLFESFTVLTQWGSSLSTELHGSVQDSGDGSFLWRGDGYRISVQRGQIQVGTNRRAAVRDGKLKLFRLRQVATALKRILLRVV